MKQRIAGWISPARAIWVAGLLTVASGATTQAAVLNFLIESNGGLEDTFFVQPVSVDGEFTFDTATSAISNFKVTLTGGGGALYGTYTNTSSPHVDLSNPDLPVIAFAGPNPDGNFLRIGLRLSGLLGDMSSEEIVGGYYFLDPDPVELVPRDPQNRPSVAVVVSAPPPPVPEPSTWAMVLGAFAGAAGWMRAHRRKLHLHD